MTLLWELEKVEDASPKVMACSFEKRLDLEFHPDLQPVIFVQYTNVQPSVAALNHFFS